MPKLIYAEPDDEITNLVDRLRSEKTEKELVFVLPGSSRVMHSNLNARLLRQYSNSLGKSTSVVSPDPRTQSIAIETGFSVFPTVGAFESGNAIDKVVNTGSSVLTPSVLGPLQALAEEFAPVPAPRRSRTAAPPPVASRVRTPAAAAAVAARSGYLPYVLGGIGVLLIALILFLFVLPSATVQVVIPARAISSTPTITGSTTAPAPADTSSIQTTIQQAQEQQAAATVTSTGQKPIPAVPATAQVVITNNNALGIQFQAGHGYELSTTDGAQKFTFVPAADLTIGSGKSSPPQPVTSKSPGVGGNVPAHTITQISGAPPTVTADNSAAAAGGVDASSKTVVSQADQDGVKKSLGDQLTTKVKADLLKSAGTQKLLDETFVLSVDATFDHKPGDEVPNFNGTVTVKASQVSLDDAKVKEVLKAALKKQAPAGYDLTDNPPKLAWTLVQHDDKGGVVLNGSASGFMASAINKEDIRSHITGKSIAKARSYIQSNIDAKNVFISESPSLVPWLPYIGGRINIYTTVENTTPG